MRVITKYEIVNKSVKELQSLVGQMILEIGGTKPGSLDRQIIYANIDTIERELAFARSRIVDECEIFTLRTNDPAKAPEIYLEHATG